MGAAGGIVAASETPPGCTAGRFAFDQDVCCIFITPLQKATGDNLLGSVFYPKIMIPPLVCN
jgi:hypothetical protein